MVNLKIDYVNVDELQPYENNARFHDEDDLKAIENSIDDYGFNDPIGVWSDKNIIVEGHGRYIVAKRKGIKKVPVVRLDHLTDEQRRAYALAHNKTAELSYWNEPALALELMNIEKELAERVGFVVEEYENTTKRSQSKSLEKMELRAFEHYDYLVFVFDNTMDWLNVVNQFDVHKVDAGYGKTKKVGVGRVINGKKLLEKIQNKTPDNIEGQE